MTPNSPKSSGGSARRAPRLRTTLAVSLAALAAAALPLALTGCGSDGGSIPFSPGSGGGGQQGPTRAQGSVTFSVKWPPRDPSRLVPLAANSVKITLLRGGQEVASQVAARPTGGDFATPTSTTFDNLAGGDYVAVAEAFPGREADGGAAQARAQVGFAISDGQNTRVGMTMDSTIVSLRISPAFAFPLGGGASRRIVVSGVDAAGNVVITSARAIEFVSSDPGLVAVVPDTATPDDDTDATLNVLQAVESDEVPVTITATDRESGKSVQLTVRIVPVGLNQNAPWAKFRGDLANSGAVRDTAALFGPISNVASRSLARTGGGNIVLASPVVAADGTVYIGGEDGFLRAFDGSSGAQKWAFNTGGPIQGTPLIARDGAVYIGSGNGKFYCLEAANGAQRWAFPAGAATLPGAVIAPPAIGEDGLIYFGTSPADPEETAAAFYALDGLSGQQIWAFSPDGLRGIQTAPAVRVRGGVSTVYFGSLNDRLYALDGKNGTVRATLDVPNFTGFSGVLVSAAPALSPDGNTLYLGTGNEQAPRLHALNADTLAPQWEFDTQAPVYASPAVDPVTGDIYVATFDIISDNGQAFQSKVWALQPSGQKVEAFNADGVNVWENGVTLFDTFVASSPLIDSAGVVYFGAYDDTVYAIDPTLASIAAGPQDLIAWAVKVTPGTTAPDAGDIDSSPAIGPDGKLYIGSVDGNLYVLEEGAGSTNRSRRRGGAAPSLAADRSRGSAVAPAVGSAGRGQGTRRRLPNFLTR